MVWQSSNVSAGDDVLAEQYNDLRTDVAEAFESAVPLGSITMWAGATGDVPTGWNLCDGSAISRTTYSDLYTLLGTTYGSGDGSTTFNIPDMRDRFVVGAGTSYSRNAKGGASSNNLSHTHTVNSHTHSIAQHSHTVSSHNHSISQHNHTAGSHRHYTGEHSHGAGSYKAEFYRTSTYDSYANFASSGSWTSDTKINLYNSSSSSTGQSRGLVIIGSSDSANAGYTDYRNPTTSTAGATSTGSKSPGTTTAGATSTGGSSLTSNSGGSSSQENRPLYIGLYYIIKIE